MGRDTVSPIFRPQFNEKNYLPYSLYKVRNWTIVYQCPKTLFDIVSIIESLF